MPHDAFFKLINDNYTLTDANMLELGPNDTDMLEFSPGIKI